MINTKRERLITFRQAAAGSFGPRIHVSCLYRWHTKGVRGVKLETVLVGGRRLTSVEACERFSRAVNAAADGRRTESESACTLRDRQAAIARAERQLAEAGIGAREEQPAPARKTCGAQTRRWTHGV